MPLNKKNKTIIEINILNKNTSLKGDIISEGDFRIDGTVIGNLTIKGKIFIGVTGIVQGKIEASNAEIEGNYSGNLMVLENLSIKSSAIISGDVIAGKLSIEPGASFNATCEMKGVVKELNQKKLQEKKVKEIRPAL